MICGDVVEWVSQLWYRVNWRCVCEYLLVLVIAYSRCLNLNCEPITSKKTILHHIEKSKRKKIDGNETGPNVHRTDVTMRALWS